MKKSKLLLVCLIISASFVLSACTRSEETSTNQSDEHSSMHVMTVKDEKDFLNQMIPHHQEAIDTSKIIESQTADQDLKKFAQDVINVQEAEIVQMKQWLKDWYQEEYDVNNVRYVQMMGDLTVLQGTELEKKYIEGMIHHHEGAIDMAKQVLTMNPRAEVKKMAEDIIALQGEEVSTLQGWLSKY